MMDMGQGLAVVVVSRMSVPLRTLVVSGISAAPCAIWPAEQWQCWRAGTLRSSDVQPNTDRSCRSPGLVTTPHLRPPPSVRLGKHGPSCGQKSGGVGLAGRVRPARGSRRKRAGFHATSGSRECRFDETPATTGAPESWRSSQRYVSQKQVEKGEYMAASVEFEDANGQVVRYVRHPNGGGLVSPRAWVHEAAVVASTAYVEAGAQVGDGSRIGAGSWVDHDVVVGKGVVVAGNVHLGPRTRAGDGTWIGTGARVGSDVVIGRGARVARDAVVRDAAVVRRRAGSGRSEFGTAA